MPLVSSPLLVDHAIGHVFESFGSATVKRIRVILRTARNICESDVPVTALLRTCGCDAVLAPAYADYSLGRLWAVIDEKEEEERAQLCASFQNAFS